jgi:DNA-binding response OmpR family regulator
MSGRILVVDDDPAAADELRAALQEHSVAVDGVADAASAVETLSRGGYCAMVLDLVLESGTGFEVLQQMHERALTIPTIVVSGKLPAYVREMLHEEQVKLVFPKGTDTHLIASVLLGLCAP